MENADHCGSSPSYPACGGIGGAGGVMPLGIHAQ
jgi:hypothetical protein